MLIDGIKLPATNGVEQDFSGFLNALEEGVIFGITGSSLLIGVMTKDFFTVGPLDLVLSGAIAVLSKTENCIVVLSLL